MFDCLRECEPMPSTSVGSVGLPGPGDGETPKKWIPMMTTAALPQVCNVTLIANLAFIKVGLITNDKLGIITIFKLAS